MPKYKTKEEKKSLNQYISQLKRSKALSLRGTDLWFYRIYNQWKTKDPEENVLKEDLLFNLKQEVQFLNGANKRGIELAKFYVDQLNEKNKNQGMRQ